MATDTFIAVSPILTNHSAQANLDIEYEQSFGFTTYIEIALEVLQKNFPLSFNLTVHYSELTAVT